MTANTEILFVVEEAAEGGYVARGIGADIVTEADTLDELRANVREAVECHFVDGAAPRLVRHHFVRDEVLTV
jgi:predicted RNase H-like HicB family nuclease